MITWYKHTMSHLMNWCDITNTVDKVCSIIHQTQTHTHTNLIKLNHKVSESVNEQPLALPPSP